MGWLSFGELPTESQANPQPPALAAQSPPTRWRVLKGAALGQRCPIHGWWGSPPPCPPVSSLCSQQLLRLETLLSFMSLPDLITGSVFLGDAEALAKEG